MEEKGEAPSRVRHNPLRSTWGQGITHRRHTHHTSRVSVDKKQQGSDRKRNVVQKKKQRDFIQAKHSVDIQNKALKFMGAFHKYCL